MNHRWSVTPITQGYCLTPSLLCHVLALPKKQGRKRRAWRALWRPPGLICRGDSCGDSRGDSRGSWVAEEPSREPPPHQPGREPPGFRHSRFQPVWPCPRPRSGFLLCPLPTGGCASQSPRHPDTPATVCQCSPLRSGCQLLFCSCRGKTRVKGYF